MIPNASWCLSSNFGDAIQPWVYEKILGHRPVYVQPNGGLEYILLGGSILNHANEHAVVWGAGLAAWSDGVPKAQEIRVVRGPISRMRAHCGGNKCPEIYGDPAVLAPTFYTPKTQRGMHPVGVFPHYVDLGRANFDWARGVQIIDPLQPVEDVIDQVWSCERVYSSALHGLIIADAYGVPNRGVRMGSSIGGDGAKYVDWNIVTRRGAWDTPPNLLDWESDMDAIDFHSKCTAAPKEIIEKMQEELMRAFPR